MRKFLITIGVLFLGAILGAILLSACNDAEVDLQPSTFETVNNLTDLSSSIKENTLTETGAVIIYANQTDSKLTYGEAYVLEKKVDGSWYQLPYLGGDGVSFIEIAYILDPHSTVEWEVDWESIYGPLDLGNYRLVKDFLAVQEAGDYDTYHTATEFTLDLPH